MTPKRPAKKIKAKPAKGAPWERMTAQKMDSMAFRRGMGLVRWHLETLLDLRAWVEGMRPDLEFLRAENASLCNRITAMRQEIDRLKREREELNAKVNAPPDRFWNWEQAGELRMSDAEIAEVALNLRLADDTPNPLHDIERREAMRKGIDEVTR